MEKGYTDSRTLRESILGGTTSKRRQIVVSGSDRIAWHWDIRSGGHVLRSGRTAYPTPEAAAAAAHCAAAAL